MGMLCIHDKTDKAEGSSCYWKWLTKPSFARATEGIVSTQFHDEKYRRSIGVGGNKSRDDEVTSPGSFGHKVWTRGTIGRNLGWAMATQWRDDILEFRPWTSLAYWTYLSLKWFTLFASLLFYNFNFKWPWNKAYFYISCRRRNSILVRTRVTNLHYPILTIWLLAFSIWIYEMNRGTIIQPKCI